MECDLVKYSLKPRNVLWFEEGEINFKNGNYWRVACQHSTTSGKVKTWSIHIGTSPFPYICTFELGRDFVSIWDKTLSDTTHLDFHIICTLCYTLMDKYTSSLFCANKTKNSLKQCFLVATSYKTVIVLLLFAWQLLTRNKRNLSG